MSSPFSMFRRHQKVLMVVVTGLSMISFVLMGMVTDYQNLPLPLMVLFLACVLGGVAALAGMRSGNASEWGVTGLLMGILVGLVFMYFARQNDVAVFMDSGNINEQELLDLRRQRGIANGFVQLAFEEQYGRELLSHPMLGQYFGSMMAQNMFGFSGGTDDPTTNDLVVGEIFRRKGKEMGLAISDDRVLDFVNKVGGSKMKREQFARIRQSLRVTELDLMKAIKEEMIAKEAANLLLGRNNITPESFWEFHRQLNVKQSAEVAAVPVDKFLESEAVPPVSELQQFFDRYRKTFAGFDEQLRPVPGRPGFYQPRRMQLAYFEANREALESAIPPVTDAEVEALYKSKYQREMPSLDIPKLDGPALPPPTNDNRPLPEAPAPVKPDLSLPPAENPPVQTPPAGNPAAPENPALPPAQNPPADRPMSALPGSGNGLQAVAFYQDPPAGENAAPANPPAGSPVNPPVEGNAPPADNPAGAANPNPPADGTAPPIVPPAPENPGGSALPMLNVSPPPTIDAPVLDDELKADLRMELHNMKVTDEVRKRISAAQLFMNDIGYKVQMPADNPAHVKLEDATKQMEEYAQKNGLRYVTTPLMTLDELYTSEEFPVGQSIATLGGQSYQVVQLLRGSAPTDLFRPEVGNLTTGQAMTSFAWWKVQDKPPFIPESMDDEQIKKQVLDAWRTTMAQPRALARAEELAKLVRESDKSVPEALADVTVTGKAGDVYLEVKPTGEFSWMQPGLAPATSMSEPPPVRPADIANVTKPGEEFYKMVCETLKEGETGVVPNQDHSIYYVVKVLSRIPGNPEQLETLRQEFLRAGNATSYNPLAQQLLSSHTVGILDKLFEDEKVMIYEDPAAPPPAQ